MVLYNRICFNCFEDLTIFIILTGILITFIPMIYSMSNSQNNRHSISQNSTISETNPHVSHTYNPYYIYVCRTKSHHLHTVTLPNNNNRSRCSTRRLIVCTMT